MRTFFSITEALRELRHDVLTVLEANQAEQGVPDAEVLAFAKGQQRGVLTLNCEDFIALHRESPEHAGMIVCTLDTDFSGQARRIHKVPSEQASITR